LHLSPHSDRFPGSPNNRESCTPMKHIALVLSLLVVGSATAQNPQVVPLWPGKPADDVAIVGEEKIFQLEIKGKPYLVDGKPTKWVTNVTKPTLTIYRPAREKD